MFRYLAFIVLIVGLLVLVTLRLQEAKEGEFRVVTEFVVDGNAEVVATGGDGDILVYTNRKRSAIDVVDISIPSSPAALASVQVPGEPTSVAVSPDGAWAMAVVYVHEPETGEPAPDPRLPGLLALIDLREPDAAELVELIGIGHHPDSIAITVSGGELLAIVAIENEPMVVLDGVVTDDEAPGMEGDISAPGSIQIIAINPQKSNRYTVTTLHLDNELLTNSLMLYADDPQPEYVALSPGRHLAAVSLQENNGIVLVDPVAGEIVGAFSLGTAANRPADLQDDGTVSLDQQYPADALERQPLAGSRAPDAITFSPDGQYIFSADEGELALTGGRGVSAWSLDGRFVWDDGGELERQAASMDLYPDNRSEKRGIEVEGIAAGRFNTRDYIFAVAERGNFLAIYDIGNPVAPELVQIIPTGQAPESVAVVPGRNLVVVAAEKSGTLTLIEYTGD